MCTILTSLWGGKGRFGADKKGGLSCFQSRTSGPTKVKTAVTNSSQIGLCAPWMVSGTSHPPNYIIFKFLFLYPVNLQLREKLKDSYFLDLEVFVFGSFPPTPPPPGA